MEEQVVLFSKEGFTFKRINKLYTLDFMMKNSKIILPKIIDFNLVKLIYDLNNDIYERVNIQLLDNDGAILTLLMKNLFEDLGLPQRFSYLHMRKNVNDNSIIFTSKSIKTERPNDMPEESELLPIEQLNCVCDIVTEHLVKFTCQVSFDNTMNIPPFVEKTVGLILFKIFKRVKQFIENVSI